MHGYRSPDVSANIGYFYNFSSIKQLSIVVFVKIDRKLPLDLLHLYKYITVSLQSC